MEPIAIIGFGLTLPGATNSVDYWQNMLAGTSSIYHYDTIDPHFLEDCYSEGAIRVNKTYSTLCGTLTDAILEQAADKAAIAFPPDYARVQKMMYLALHEALGRANLSDQTGLLDGVRAFLGATPDGIAEYDDALVIRHLEQQLVSNAHGEQRQALETALRETLPTGSPEQFSPSVVYDQVLRDVLNRDVPVIQVDAACSSSLYAIDLAAKSLASGDSSVAVCGGAFAAGIGNNCMFAQFGGLARTAIRPFDEKAEGTVFCDGAVVLLLRRLRDAIADGNPVYGVIRGMGLSSDGRAAAVNVPVSAGQKLAIERCYEHSGIDKDSIQYVEAHATSTSGDAVEFSSLKQVFGDRDTHLPRIGLGSNKALIGHTGWASGASAVAKMLMSFGSRTMAGQHGLDEVNRKFDIESSPFDIPRLNDEWPTNIDGEPRRCAINGFGFGGTNAHLILEEFDARYHSELVSRNAPGAPDSPCVIVGVNSVFPGAGTLADRVTSKRIFEAGDFTLPPGKLVLPDIREHMARAQFLAVMAADPLLALLRERGVDFARVGIVLAFNDKCERGCAANLHIYKDRLLRLMRQEPGAAELEQATREWYSAFEASHLATNPYTLAGIMPNVITGRVANLFDLKGPNFIVGDNRNHGLEAVQIAQDLVRHGDADVVLCGGLHLESSPFRTGQEEQEGIVMFAVAGEKLAKEHGLPVYARCSLSPRHVSGLEQRMQTA